MQVFGNIFANVCDPKKMVQVVLKSINKCFFIGAVAPPIIKAAQHLTNMKYYYFLCFAITQGGNL